MDNETITKLKSQIDDELTKLGVEIESFTSNFGNKATYVEPRQETKGKVPFSSFKIIRKWYTRHLLGIKSAKKIEKITSGTQILTDMQDLSYKAKSLEQEKEAIEKDVIRTHMNIKDEETRNYMIEEGIEAATTKIDEKLSVINSAMEKYREQGEKIIGNMPETLRTDTNQTEPSTSTIVETEPLTEENITESLTSDPMVQQISENLESQLTSVISSDDQSKMTFQEQLNQFLKEKGHDIGKYSVEDRRKYNDLYTKAVLDHNDSVMGKSVVEATIPTVEVATPTVETATSIMAEEKPETSEEYGNIVTSEEPPVVEKTAEEQSVGSSQNENRIVQNDEKHEEFMKSIPLFKEYTESVLNNFVNLYNSAVEINDRLRKENEQLKEQLSFFQKQESMNSFVQQATADIYSTMPEWPMYLAPEESEVVETQSMKK